MALAASLPGKALHLAMCIWFRAGITRTSTVRVSSEDLRQVGVQRHAGYRALEELRKAGLISVARHRGRCPVVTIIVLETADE